MLEKMIRVDGRNCDVLHEANGTVWLHYAETWTIWESSFITESMERSSAFQRPHRHSWL